jgi:hypothetical protein
LAHALLDLGATNEKMQPRQNLRPSIESGALAFILLVVMQRDRFHTAPQDRGEQLTEK